MITAHLLDSLAVRPLMRGRRVLDVGTGAGFPGLPLAIVEPEMVFDLIDSNNRKIMFVQHVAGALQLDNVHPVQARAEDYAPGYRFDTVIARAGVFVALKGRYPLEELQSLPEDWQFEVTELKVPGLDAGSRHAVLIERK